MNIIETVNQLLTDCPLIQEFTNDIHIDFTTNETGDYGLFSNGDTKVKEDILGNQTRQHNFVLNATNQSFNDFNRLQNSSFLLDLAYWLETVKGQEVTAEINGVKYSGAITKLWSANGMMYQVPNGNIADGVMYQLQIYAQYKLKKE
ncbi:MAG: hypothetical protein ACI4FZ_08755 [Lachnospiraceae bacterium]